MEGARRVEEGVFDELDDASVGDGRFFLQVDGGAPVDGRFEERILRGYIDWARGLGWVCHADGEQGLVSAVSSDCCGWWWFAMVKVKLMLRLAGLCFTL